MNAVAISNNDMVYLHWNVDGKIPDCLGFSVIRHDTKTNSKEALPGIFGVRVGCFADPAFEHPAKMYFSSLRYHWLSLPRDVELIETQ